MLYLIVAVMHLNWRDRAQCMHVTRPLAAPMAAAADMRMCVYTLTWLHKQLCTSGLLSLGLCNAQSRHVFGLLQWATHAICMAGMAI